MNKQAWDDFGKAYMDLITALYGVPSIGNRAGLSMAQEALHGPPPTPDELALARTKIAAQKARDFGIGGGLFETTGD